MKKECKVHRLVTESNSNVHYNKIKDDSGIRYELSYHSEISKCGNTGLIAGNQHLYITSDEEIKEGDWFFDTITKATQQMNMNPKNLLSVTRRKIIATTDALCKHVTIIEGVGGVMKNSVPLPQIPELFIKDYCDKGGIDTVLAEYETLIVDKLKGNKEIHYFGFEYDEAVSAGLVVPVQIDILKIALNGTIIMHPLEEKMYSREELAPMFKHVFIQGGKCARNFEYDFDIDNWIKENLK